jgi:hypothetical protein
MPTISSPRRKDTQLPFAIMNLLLPLMQDEVGLLPVSSIAGEVLIQLDEHCKAFVDVH